MEEGDVSLIERFENTSSAGRLVSTGNKGRSGGRVLNM